MCKRILMLLVVITAIAFNSVALAQDKASPEAVQNLFKALNVQENYEKGMQVMLDAQIQAQPQLQPLRSVMENFFKKYASWDKIENTMLDLYATEFTDDELAEITTFITTPAGKKWVQKQPLLTAKAMEQAQKTVQQHTKELQQELLKEMMKLQKTAGDQPAKQPVEKPAPAGDDEEF